ncbi:hypothetical protein MIMGU_mgv1a014302mg [Erythranthe guttata]|uniref:Cyclin-dependent kinase inhibitor n=1 Tax=Erythranthe guttata TaxID=4155 RepID=A0A022RKB5_ERYGU|nr:hypothetical protein MIMGU_mgv1a014302mg [Erythranthe guttata]
MDTAAAAAVGSKRKVGLEERQLSECSIQLKTRRIAVAAPEDSASSENSENSTCEVTDHCLASCSSSYGSTELSKGRSKFLDLEENEVSLSVEFFATSAGHSSDSRERRETTPLSDAAEPDSAGELESTARPRETSNRRRSTAAEKMPSEAELEEFFAAAENNLHKQFTNKYNYDIVKDQPLEGRYEWVQIQVKP